MPQTGALLVAMAMPHPQDTKEEKMKQPCSTHCRDKFGLSHRPTRADCRPCDSPINRHPKHGSVQQTPAAYCTVDGGDASSHPTTGYSVVSLLKSCIRFRDLETGKEIHDRITGNALLERDLFVGATVVDMYVKCGSLLLAEAAFENLQVRNVVAWTILMAAYADNGHVEKAIDCFERMRLEGISPNAFTFVCAIKACCRSGEIGKGQDIHMDVRRQALTEDIFIASALVDMYAKLGQLDEAQGVCLELPIRNVVVWTALLAGFVQHGVATKALWCFQQMQLEGIPPNGVTIASSLTACSNLLSREKGREIHTMAHIKGLVRTDLYVGSSLVDMYAKCGLISTAKRVFGEITLRNEILWNVLISGHVEYGQGGEALQCLTEMQLEGIAPDYVTFLCGLKACSNIGALGKGREIHAEIETQGLVEKDLAMGNTLIDMYAKCGSLSMAQRVFDRLYIRNIVSWNALIAGYTENGYGGRALELFKQMQLDDTVPDAVTYLCILKACASIEAADKAEEILAETEKSELETNPFIGSTLVSMYAKCGSLTKGQEVFHTLRLRDVVSWNALLTAFAEYGRGEEALECFEKMQFEGVSPNAVTFLSCLKACSSIGATDKGQKIHVEIERRGMFGREHIGNTLVDMYAKCGSIELAQQVFNQLTLRDVISWTALIMGYAQLGQSESVFGNFEQMIRQGIKPSPVTLVVILSACSQSGLLNKSQTYFEAMSKDLGMTPTVKHHACVVDLICRIGYVEEAMGMINRLPKSEMLHIVLGASRNFGIVEFGRQAFRRATCQ